MYLYHFGYRKLPFSLTPDTGLYCALDDYTNALNTLRFALSSGEAFCKITGEVGCGKTLLCRLLIKKIGEQRKVAYIPNPVLSPRELKFALASELNLRFRSNIGEDEIIPRIQEKLIEENKKCGPIILIIDEAQSMPDETLETLRLFTNLETETSKLLQIVLFGQPELDEKLKQKHLRQIRQRIVFSFKLKPLNFLQTKKYIEYRQQKVSTIIPVKLSFLALLLIYRCSRGVPRLINILSHKSLMLAYGKHVKKVTASMVWQAAKDTEDSLRTIKTIKWVLLLAFGLFSSSAMALWMLP